MARNPTRQKTIKWTARILSLAILLVALPFYFGYGNPLPFTNPNYQWIENAWLSLLPITFLGLVLGWKYPKIGGYLIVLPIALGVILGLVAKANFSINMLVLLIPGALYLIAGYGENPASPD